MRTALNDAAPLYRDAPEAKRRRRSGDDQFGRFMREALPSVEEPARKLAQALVVSTLTSVGKRFSSRARTRAEIASFAAAMADMFSAYIEAASLRR